MFWVLLDDVSEHLRVVLLLAFLADCLDSELIDFRVLAEETVEVIAHEFVMD